MAKANHESLSACVACPQITREFLEHAMQWEDQRFSVLDLEFEFIVSKVFIGQAKKNAWIRCFAHQSVEEITRLRAETTCDCIARQFKKQSQGAHAGRLKLQTHVRRKCQLRDRQMSN